MAEESSQSMLWLVAAFGIGGTVGYAAGSIVTATIGGLVSVCVVGVGIAIARARATATALDGPAPDLRGLEPKQALAVLGSVAQGNAAHSLDLESPQGEAVEEIQATTDPVQALALAYRHVDKFPRSGLVRAELARQLLIKGDEEAARAAMAEAIAQALDGGSNPLAARLFVEFFEHRDALDLPPLSLRRLAGAVEAAGHPDAATWCRTQSEPS